MRYIIPDSQIPGYHLRWEEITVKFMHLGDLHIGKLLGDFDLYDDTYIRQLHLLQSFNQDNKLFLNKDSVAQFYAISYDDNYDFGENKDLTTFAKNIHDNLKDMQNLEKYKELYTWILNKRY